MVVTAEDERDKLHMEADLDAMEQSVAPPAQPVPMKPAAASPIGRKRPFIAAEEKRALVPVQNGEKSAAYVDDDDDDEDSGVEEVPAPPKTTLLASTNLAAAAEPSSMLSKEEKRQAKLRKFIKENVKRYAWLETPHDSPNRPPNHPDYDSSTLYIPANAQRAFTPFEQQYWDIKKKYFDTVVFFRKGKVRPRAVIHLHSV